jgi:hypothetical protein
MGPHRVVPREQMGTYGDLWSSLIKLLEKDNFISLFSQRLLIYLYISPKPLIGLE